MKNDSNLIYSPEEKIPIGEPVVMPEGAHGIRFKWRRGKKDVTETVTLDKLHELVAQHKDKKPAVREPRDGGTRPK